MKILLIGQTGQLAHELQRSLACLGDLISLGRNTHPSLDLGNPDHAEATILDLRPKLIVNAAAYTQVDQAESDPTGAFKINSECLYHITRAARKIQSPLIHYSSDYVFEGSAGKPYLETDSTGPKGIYGESKLQGEAVIRGSGIPHLIFRTSWVYGLHGHNFLNTMLRLMAERDQLKVVNDQIGAPTWSRQIAEATALCMAHCLAQGDLGFETLTGTYHLSAAGKTSWCGFAEKIREYGLSRGYLDEGAARIQPIPTEQYPTPAQRPHYSVLDNERILRTFGIQIPHWEAGLSLCLEAKAAQSPT